MTYDNIVVICMGELNIKRLDEIHRLTLNEFYYRMQAQEVIALKEEYNLLKLAFFIRDAAATENRGTDRNPKEYYKYASIHDIMDYQDNFHRIFEGKSRVYKIGHTRAESTENDRKLAALLAEFNNRE
ncbi:hypothetical protein GT368_09160 [Staphylococcus pseudintermedius]|uniref:hypothetical protein n=2 Tax=Staphylococcus pseudintermedius TaxID=283734 RepID=UPI0009D7862C|nr:hypothetical protein [Staphylococcus pseudintermedius]EGQ0367444.1 hypothetical protein [Staphylococcus pseudintermedius]EGQ2895293.1 hypothetical protein [Staphylococcus pseudintermedius]EGQ2923572.1 hypothetical protein [Staphylococcus pseudintermedius]EGQ4380263.1 hypothetical protein [Staphylococcus pseudintermedius]EIE3748365.1 hypothetical protein [Staphylococcus pseudintermedius]